MHNVKVLDLQNILSNQIKINTFQRGRKMKQNKKCVLLALMLFAALSFCLLVPAYAMPSVRDGIVTDRDGIIEGDSDVTLPKVTLPNQNGTMTPSEQETGDGGSAVMPGLTDGADTSDRTPSTNSPATDRTTASVTTQSPRTTQSPDTSAPTTTAQDEADGNGMAVWGVILAIIIIAAVAVILYMLFAKRR